MPQWKKTYALSSVDAHGGRKREKITLNVHWRSIDSRPWYSHFHFQAELGWSYLHFKEVRAPNYREIAQNLALSTGYAFLKGTLMAWVGLQATLFPYYKSQSEVVRFLGVDGRIGYLIPKLENTPWSVWIFAGWYYITMPTPNNFGFVDMSGPQVYPAVRYQITPKHSVSTFFKYSPVSSSLNRSIFKNYEIAWGATYGYAWSKKWELLGGFKISRIDLNIDSVDVENTSYTLSAGIRF